jgi:predicted transcriptional regulator
MLLAMTTLKLTDEIRAALEEHPDQPLEIEDEVTRRVYLLVAKPIRPEMIHRTAREAIQAGIDDMEAGRCVPYEEVSQEVSAKFGIEPIDEHDAVDWEFSIDEPPRRPAGTLRVLIGQQVELSPPLVEDPFA